MTSATVLLVGAGNLGSRYLQGLKSVAEHLLITVVDPSAEALVLAERRWDHAELGGTHSRPVFRNSVSEAVENGLEAWDLAIVSTAAQQRLEVVTEIAAGPTVRHWVLEKVLAQSPSDVRALEKQIGTATAAFVNTNRRMMLGYAELKNMFVPPLSIEISGGKWGLASNAIHFIDMAAWMTDARLAEVDATSEDGGWYTSKRVDYFDMTGKTMAAFTDGTDLTMMARANEAPLTISIADSTGSHWVIDQGSGTARSRRGEAMQVDLELQSAMTSRLVTQLLATGSCDLTTLRESARMHEPLLRALLNDWNAATGRSDCRVPIT